MLFSRAEGRWPDCRGRIRLCRELTRGLSFVALAFLATRATAAPTEREVKAEREIKAAIDKAVAYLRQSLPSLDEGRTSLATLALLKAGVSKDSPEMKAALEKIASRVSSDGKFNFTNHFNYDGGVTLMALANADAKKYRPQIEAIAKFLIANQGTDGDWDYPMRAQGDTSISQYAVLGLWEASRAGVTVPRGVWDKAARWHITRQQNDGGFAYHPGGPGGGGGSTHTMTVAGTASLLVARMHLFGSAGDQSDVDDDVPVGTRKRNRKKFGLLIRSSGDAEDPSAEEAAEAAAVGSGPLTTRLNSLDKSVGGGRKWIADRFMIEPPTMWKMYYLYGLERLAALAGVQQIAGHDWYEEGAARLVATQGAGGTWDDGCGTVAATSFGVMFLVKATQKMLNRQPRQPRFGGGLLIGGRGLPENLEDAQLDKGLVKVRKLKGPVDELLAALENAESQTVESAQAALIDSIANENPESLIGQTDRVLKLARDKRPEVRRTAYWALGRTNDLRVAPVLINGLLDVDLSCVVEARNALRYLSKRLNYIELPDEPTEAQRAQAVAQWKKWYQSVRPYDERDDLEETTKP